MKKTLSHPTALTLVTGALLLTALGMLIHTHNAAAQAAADVDPICLDIYAQTIPDYQGELDDVCHYDYMKGAHTAR